jgi:hypothetical protein
MLLLPLSRSYIPVGGPDALPETIRVVGRHSDQKRTESMESLRLYETEAERRQIVKEVRQREDVLKPEDAVRYLAPILQATPAEALRIAEDYWVKPSALVSD